MKRSFHTPAKGVALVTGCSSGFGFRTALLFARKGYMTYAGVRNMTGEGTLQLQKMIRKEQLPLKVIELDISKDKSVSHAVSLISKKEKGIDVLVNNAGWGYRGAVEEHEIGEVLNLYQTNVFGMLRMVKAVAPLMRKQKSGIIINISSINGLIPFPMMGVYSSSKYALETLTEVLRFELSHFGIRVTQVEPGAFLTEGNPRNFITSRTSQTPASVYKKVQTRYIDMMERARTSATRNPLLYRLMDPQHVANFIYQISQNPHPKMRYRIGFDAHLYYWVKKIFPESVWEWLMHRIYNW